MELEVIKNLNKITTNDLINFEKDVKIMESNTEIQFPKVLSDFYKQIGIRSSLFKSVINTFKINDYNILEIHIDDQTGDKWGLNIDKNYKLYFKPINGEWTNVKYSISDFLINELLKVSCFTQSFSASGTYSNNELKAGIDKGYIREIKIKQIDLKIANIYDLKMTFYQSLQNDIIGVGKEYIHYGVNNKADFEKFISSFGKNWYAPWLGLYDGKWRKANTI